jgi:hypothetical protein
MLTFATLQDRPREFLAATGLTHDEFARVLPAFAAAYTVLEFIPIKSWVTKGAGAPGNGARHSTVPVWSVNQALSHY